MTGTQIPEIDSAHWAERLLQIFPRDWTGDAAKKPGGILYSLFEAFGVEFERTRDNIEYGLLTSRLATATDEALDAAVADYFSEAIGFPANIVRQVGEPDESFRHRAMIALLPSAVTRQALIDILTKFVGSEPRVFEPWRFIDNGMLDGWTYFDVDTLDNPGRFADPGLKYQGFIESALPPYNSKVGNTPLYGMDIGFCFDSPSGYLFDPEPTWWQQSAALDTLINKSKIFGTYVWRRYSQDVLTSTPLGGTEHVIAGQTSATVEVYPAFAGAYIVLASANWNTEVSWTMVSNSTFKLNFGIPAPGANLVDWIALPISIPYTEFLYISPDTESVDLGIQHEGYIPVAALSWNSNLWISEITDSIATVSFAVPAPDQATICAYLFDPGSGGVDSPDEGDTSIMISGEIISGNYQVFVLPTWNTTCEVVKGESYFDVLFSVPAPSGASVYWGVHKS